ncbi:MAG: DUF4349 domain-containing protein [Candidatus Micrarchaeota archaeon]|nr:DUF4349 domain-containing protein [Candidatus Micrarchaeota archaeon]
MKLNIFFILLFGIFLLSAGCAGLSGINSTTEQKNDISSSDYFPVTSSSNTFSDENSISYSDAPLSDGANYEAKVSDTFTGEQPLKTKEGSISIKLERGQLDEKVKGATGIVETQGGTVISTSYDEYSGQKHYSISFKISPEKFDSVFEQLKNLGELKGANVNIEDVTKQYRDLDLRLQNKNIELQRLYILYNKSELVEDLITVEREITRIETEIEQLKNEKGTLEGKIQKSTITLDLYEDVAASEAKEGDMTVKVNEGKLSTSLDSLKAVVADEGGSISSLRFVESTGQKTYYAVVQVSSNKLDSFMEKAKALGEVKQLSKDVDEKNRPEKSLVYVTLTEDKSTVKTNLQLPLEDLTGTFFAALSAALLVLSGLIGFLLPTVIIIFVIYKIYKKFKKNTSADTTKKK